jgi:hypothetical protein
MTNLNKKAKKTKEGGSICGGVIPDSIFNKDPWAYMMAYTMPDKIYKKYALLVKSGKEKEAKILFDKHAYSHI